MRVRVVAVSIFLCSGLVAGCFQDRNHSIELMNQGVELGRQKSYGAAARKFAEATSVDPSNHLAWFNLGMVQKDDKKWDDAAKAFKEASRIEMDNASYHYELGNAYQEMSRPTVSPDGLKKENKNLGKLDEAKAEYEACLKIDSKLYKAHYRLGTVLEAQEKFKEADAEYRQAIQANPRFISPYVHLGYMYSDHDYDKEAVQVFQNAVLANDADGEAHLGLGLSLQRTKQYEESIKEFKKALDLNGELYLAVYNIGITYKMMDDKKNAKEWLQRFITGGGKGAQELIKAASDAMYQLDAP